MNDKLLKDKVPCDCGGWKQPKLFNIEGMKVRGWECKKCKEIEYSDDIDRVLLLKKLKKHPVEIKYRAVGNTDVITIPKHVSELLHLHKGDKLVIKPTSLETIEVSKK